MTSPGCFDQDHKRITGDAAHRGRSRGRSTIAAGLAASIAVFCPAVAAGSAHAQVAGQTPPLSPADVVPPTEAADIDAIRAKALAGLRQHYPEGTAVLVRRDAHAKAHGCVKAVFKVDTDLAPELRVGTFARVGQSHKAWIRFSNGAFHPGADTGYDGRGLALKIIYADPGDGVAARDPAVHDILMINHPAFFSSTAADYRAFADAGALAGATDGLKGYFLPSLNPFGWRLRQARIAYNIASKSITSPLQASYFSMAPFTFGANRWVKYSARPCPRAAPAAAQGSAPRSENFLREALVSTLDREPACFELMVQERKGDMPLDDATVEWSEAVSPYRRVGEIAVPKQSVASVARDLFCEAVTFNPWRAPAAHAPAGGINRVRKAVYDATSEYRSKRNSVGPIDPQAEWDGK